MELLIVLGILSVLAGIALPVTRGLIAENRVSESVRTVQSFIEAARAKAMSTGRDHGVVFLRGRLDPTLIVADPNGAGDVLGTCTALKLVAGMPSYRGDVEGCMGTFFHDESPSTLVTSGGAYTGPLPANGLDQIPNCMIVRRSECPTLLQSLEVCQIAASGGVSSQQLSIADGDALVIDGVRCPIVAFAECNGNETPFAKDGPLEAFLGNSGLFLKVYFDAFATSATRGLRPATVPALTMFPLGGPSMTSPVPDHVRRRTFEIERNLLRPTANQLTLQRGAAVDLLYSGLGAGGSEFSPLTIAGATTPADLAAPSTPYWDVTVVFSPSGEVSRIIYGQLQVGGVITLITRVPPSSVHFLVGRSDEVRADLAFLGRLPAGNANDLSNLVDTRARWLSINPTNGRITSTAVRTPTAAATSTYQQLLNARFPALEAREQL